MRRDDGVAPAPAMPAGGSNLVMMDFHVAAGVLAACVMDGNANAGVNAGRDVDLDADADDADGMGVNVAGAVVAAGAGRAIVTVVQYQRHPGATTATLETGTVPALAVVVGLCWSSA